MISSVTLSLTSTCDTNLILFQLFIIFSLCAFQVLLPINQQLNQVQPGFVLHSGLGNEAMSSDKLILASNPLG